MPIEYEQLKSSDESLKLTYVNKKIAAKAASNLGKKRLTIQKY
jgi:hypothetical protein